MAAQQVQMPNVLGMTLAGYDKGRERGAQNQLQQAVTQHGLRSPEAMNALSMLNPMGAAQMDQARDQFGARMGQQAEQFGATMGLNREKFDYAREQDAQAMQMRRAQMAQRAAGQDAAASQAADEARTQKGAALLAQVMQVPEGQREAAWQQGRQIAAQMGLSVEGLPEQYPGDAAVQMMYSQMTGQILDGPAAPAPSSAVAKIEADRRAGLISDEQADAAIAKATRVSGGQSLSVGPDGSVTFNQGGGIDGAPKLTEGQSKDLVYVQRAMGAADILDGIDAELGNYGDSALSKVPVVGNSMVSEEFQRAKQAGREWTTAVLRKDTGAAVTEAEEKLYNEMYLPLPGDSEATIKQKRAARTRAIEAMRSGIGSAEVILKEVIRSKGGALPAAPDGVDADEWQTLYDDMTDEEKELFR